jgi:hypothetical protein
MSLAAHGAACAGRWLLTAPVSCGCPSSLLPVHPGQTRLRARLSGISHDTVLSLYRGTSAFGDTVFDHVPRAFVVPLPRVCEARCHRDARRGAVLDVRLNIIHFVRAVGVPTVAANGSGMAGVPGPGSVVFVSPSGPSTFSCMRSDILFPVSLSSTNPRIR